jgi:tetratricopeptide (TPR) repeat protein
MPSQQVSIKKYLIPIMVLGAAALSYFYSGDVYSWYMRTYYEKVQGQSIEQQINKAREMYQNHEYEKLRDKLERLTVVYPENIELKKLEGLTLIKLGRRREGAEIILSAFEGGRMPEKLLESTVNALFEEKMHRDILIVFKKNNPGGNSNLLYWYGISLYETGGYARSAEYMKKALDRGKTGYEVYHYIGMALEKSGNTRASLPYLERARSLNRDDPDVAFSLANAYRKLGRFKDAAKIMRNIKKMIKLGAAPTTQRGAGAGRNKYLKSPRGIEGAIGLGITIPYTSHLRPRSTPSCST